MSLAMTEPQKTAVQELRGWIGLPNSVVEGTVLVNVNLNPLELSLTGGGLETDGWVASGNTITLSPLPNAALPILYQLSFQPPEGFRLVDRGLQVSGSVSESSFAACVMDSPLELINGVMLGGEKVTLNLGMILQSPTGETLNFGDPTIVFDPPQT